MRFGIWDTRCFAASGVYFGKSHKFAAMTEIRNSSEHTGLFKNRTFLFGWLPLIIGILLIASFFVVRQPWWSTFVFFAILLGVSYYLTATIVWAIKKRWKMMALSLVSSLILATPLTVLIIGMLAMGAMLGPSEDGFADNLSLPAGVELAEPRSRNEPGITDVNLESGNLTDPFQDALMASLETPAQGDSTLTANVSNLESLAKNHPDLLKRFLSARPEWRVFQERGNRYATRRLSLIHI